MYVHIKSLILLLYLLKISALLPWEVACGCIGVEGDDVSFDLFSYLLYLWLEGPPSEYVLLVLVFPLEGCVEVPLLEMKAFADDRSNKGSILFI